MKAWYKGQGISAGFLPVERKNGQAISKNAIIVAEMFNFYIGKGENNMVKRLITVWLSITMLLFSTISIYAYAGSVTVQGTYLLKDFVINGQNILNYKLNDPVVAYNDYIYVPLDEPMGDLLGISASMDSGSRTVYITQKDREWVDFCQGGVVNNLDDLTMTAQTDVSAYVVTDAHPEGAPLDLNNRPVLMYGSVLYVPLNAIVDSGLLGWTLHWNEFTGANLSTDPVMSAWSSFDKGRADYKAGLTAYIMKKNPKVSFSKARMMVEYAETYGEIYGGLDEELLIAVMESESTFYENIKNSHNCYGLMQIKAYVAASYGFSTSQLLQAKYNIQMGCILLNHGMNTFNGNVTLALSGYACGENAVKRGNYSLKFYNNWVKKFFNIVAYASTYQS